MNLTDEQIKKIVKEEYNQKQMHKIRENGLFLSDNEIDLLKRYGIDYKNYSNIMQLIYKIDEINEDDDEELDLLASYLSEQYYYNNVNK